MKHKARHVLEERPAAIARTETMSASGARFGRIRIASAHNAPDPTDAPTEPREATTSAARQHNAHGTSLIG
jgi:hypothetical protein